MSLVRLVRLKVSAGAAKPGPALGQALGPLGVNMAEFCKQFNERTDATYKKETPLTVVLSAMSDRSFTFDVRTPPTSYLIKQVLGMEKGPQKPNLQNPAGYIAPEAIYEIAKIKQMDEHMQEIPLQSIARSVIGTCRSLGVKVREVEEDTDDSGKNGLQ
ncbi:hypothetical protein ACA910_000928 [Epithemia clementina (nom. ined.)]